MSRHETKRLRWTWPDWAVLLLLAALVLLFHWSLLTPKLVDRQSFPPGDFSHQFWAFSTFEARELSAGRLPLWNPYTYAGSPFWADVQSAVLYPFSLLTLALSTLTPAWFSLFALQLEAIFHFWLGGTFMYLFLRRVLQHRGAALVGALAFTFGGYLTGYPAQQLAVLEVDVWLPLILLGLDLACCERDSYGRPCLRTGWHWPGLSLAGLAWGLALLAGHPQSWMLVGYSFAAYGLFLHLWLAPRGERWRQLRSYIFRLGTIVGLGLGLAAVQVLPAIEYTRLSVRAAGTYAAMAGGFEMFDWLQVLLPGVVSLYSPLYLGVVGLLLALAALFYAPQQNAARSEIRFWGGWGALAGLIAFGGNTFLYSPLYLFGPGFSIFRGQERWAFVFAFSFAVVLAYGARLVLRRLPDETVLAAWLNRLTGGLLLAAIALVLAFFYGLNATGWRSDNQFYALLEASVLLSLLLLGALLLWRALRSWSPSWGLGLLILILCFDLFTVNWQTNLYSELPSWHTQKPAAVAAIQADAAALDRPFRVYNEFRLYDNYGIPFELEDLWGASPLRLARYAEFLAPPMLIERAWAMLNVHYVITWRESLYVPSTVIHQEPAADGTTFVHRLDAPGPRAWLVNRVETLAPAAMVARMAEPDFAPRQQALLADDVALSPRGDDLNGRVEIIDRQPGELRLQVETDAPALLLLSEIAYPGWQVRLNGQPAAALTANYVLRAVVVPPGSHLVEWRFVSATFRLGAAVSGIALLFWLGGWLWWQRGGRR